MASVCTSLTSGMASIASQLPDISQLEQTRADLKSRGQDLTSDPEETSTPDTMEESLMSPYLPDSRDLANHQIMESAYVASSDSPFSTSEAAQKDSYQVRWRCNAYS